MTCTVADGIATVVLDNPPQNRIGVEAVAALSAALDEIETKEVRAVLLRAEGENFSYGGDIEPWPGWTERELRSHFSDFMRTFNRFEQLPVPTVAGAPAADWSSRCGPTSSSPGRAPVSGIRSSRSRS
jgi:enoyl-CoA hydratase/carnithine racemase